MTRCHVSSRCLVESVHASGPPAVVASACQDVPATAIACPATACPPITCHYHYLTLTSWFPLPGSFVLPWRLTSPGPSLVSSRVRSPPGQSHNRHCQRLFLRRPILSPCVQVASAIWPYLTAAQQRKGTTDHGRPLNPRARPLNCCRASPYTTAQPLGPKQPGGTAGPTVPACTLRTWALSPAAVHSGSRSVPRPFSTFSSQSQSHPTHRTSTLAAATCDPDTTPQHHNTTDHHRSPPPLITALGSRLARRPRLDNTSAPSHLHSNTTTRLAPPPSMPTPAAPIR